MFYLGILDWIDGVVHFVIWLPMKLRCFAAIANRARPIIAAFLASFAVIGVFAFIAASMALIFAIVGLWEPKTKGLRVEAIAR